MTVGLARIKDRISGPTGRLVWAALPLAILWPGCPPSSPVAPSNVGSITVSAGYSAPAGTPCQGSATATLDPVSLTGATGAATQQRNAAPRACQLNVAPFFGNALRPDLGQARPSRYTVRAPEFAQGSKWRGMLRLRVAASDRPQKAMVRPTGYHSEYGVPSSPILSDKLLTSKMPGSDWLTLWEASSMMIFHWLELVMGSMGIFRR